MGRRAGSPRLRLNMTAPSPLLSSGRQSVASLLAYRAESTPDRPFLMFDFGDDIVTLTYAATDRLAGRAAVTLHANGIGRGERVLVVLPNSVEFFAVWFGAAKVGAVIVPISPDSSVDEIRYVIEHAGCSAVVCGSGSRNLVEQAAPKTRFITVGIDAGDGPSDHPATQLEPTETLSIMYTSGSTGRPKGVVVTHANYLHAGATVAAQLRMRPDDRWLVVLPLFHANAQFYCVMSALISGASVAVAPRFSASRWADQVVHNDVTLASLFAAPMRMILAQNRSASDSQNRLRAVLFAQNLTQSQLDEFEERFGGPLLQWYGMTETVAPVAMNPLYGRRKGMALGLPVVPGGVRVLGEDGTEAGAHGSGELWVACIPGITGMSEYYRDPESTAATVHGGWLRTGDMVRLDDDGYLLFHDRVKHMIKRAGENIAAAEVERVVNEHPAVFESAAVGVPDPVRDEQIKVYVVVREDHTLTDDELLAHCKTFLAPYKVPSLIEFVEDLPRTSVGKIQKHRLSTASLSTPVP